MCGIAGCFYNNEKKFIEHEVIIKAGIEDKQEIDAVASGAQIFRRACSVCHGLHGEGMGTIVPPIANSDYVVANFETLEFLITNGISGKMIVNGVEYNSVMPPVFLEDQDLRKVIQYIKSLND